MKTIIIETDQSRAKTAKALCGDRTLLLVTDGTEEGEAEAEANTLRIACTGGRGEKLRRAFAVAFGELSADAVITLPAHGDTAAADIDALEEALHEGASVAVCDNREACPLLFGGLFRILTRFTAGLTVAPWASLRAYKADCAELLAEVKGRDAEYEIALMQAIVTEKLPLKQLSASAKAHKITEKCKKSFITTFLAALGILDHAPSLKFLLSSCIAFVIDTTLLTLIAPILPWHSAWSEGIAQVIAWIVSSLTNFTINRKFVFRAKGGLIAALGKYYSLAIIVLLGKEGLLFVFSTLLSLNLLVAKLISEVSFFVFNYFMQKTLIFRRKK